jgi:hypothetical protein
MLAIAQKARRRGHDLLFYVDEQPVLGSDDPATLVARQAGEGPPVVVPGVPQPRDDRHQLLRAVMPVSRQVQRPVEHQELFDIMRLLDVLVGPSAPRCRHPSIGAPIRRATAVRAARCIW